MAGIVVSAADRRGPRSWRSSGPRASTGDITLICEEPVPPYQRPPLSKAYLLGEMEEARLYLRPESFYADHGIDLGSGPGRGNRHRRHGPSRRRAGERSTTTCSR
jgi:3-phenylpropionate/trans-cinnamate dioxygenase ferredoxin reductase component